MNTNLHLRLLSVLFLLLTGCTGPTAVAQTDLPLMATLMPTAVPPPTIVATLPPLPATYAPPATPDPQPTPLIPPTETPIPSPTPDQTYWGLTIAELRNRSYGGGQIEVIETMETNESFTRYLIKYPSDGLDVYGFMNVPNEGDRFPVALVLHGFMPLDTYQTKTYTTRYADALAEAGYFVIHPSYRNHPPLTRAVTIYFALSTPLISSI